MQSSEKAETTAADSSVESKLYSMQVCLEGIGEDTDVIDAVSDMLFALADNHFFGRGEWRNLAISLREPIEAATKSIQERAEFMKAGIHQSLEACQGRAVRESGGRPKEDK